MKIFDNCVEKTVLTDADFGDVSCTNTDKPVTGCAVSNAISGMLGKTADGGAWIYYCECRPDGWDDSKPAIVFYKCDKNGDGEWIVDPYFSIY